MQHAFKRPGAWRVTLGSALLGLAMFALVASSAQAKVVTVTGDEATIAPSSQLTQFLTDHGVAVEATGAATLDAGGNLTLPIVGGLVNTKNLHGVLVTKGGVKFSKGDRSLRLHRMVAVNRGKGAFLSAKVGKHHRVRIARLTDRSTDVASGTAEADLRLSKKAARRINHVAGKHIVSAGALLGHVTATVTTG
jgi:hypothetical protein